LLIKSSLESFVTSLFAEKENRWIDSTGISSYHGWDGDVKRVDPLWQPVLSELKQPSGVQLSDERLRQLTNEVVVTLPNRFLLCSIWLCPENLRSLTMGLAQTARQQKNSMGR
jgi:hypothetical protein